MSDSILIVEDDAILSVNLHEMLTEAGYRVLNVLATGEKAVEVVQQEEKPDLIIMDVKLAGEMDGITAAQRINAIADIPLIYITAYGDNSLISQAGGTLPYAYLVKPVLERELLAAIQLALHKHNAEQKLKNPESTLELFEQEGLQQLLLKLSTDFVNIPLGRVDGAINEMLEAVGRITKVDRVYIFVHDPDRQVTTNTHEWCSEGITPQIDKLQDVPFDLIPNVMEPLQRGEMVCIPSVSLLPDNNTMRRHLEVQGIQSLVVFPLRKGESCLGFIGFDLVRGVRRFTETETALLKMMAGLITSVVERRRKEEALQKTVVQLQASFEGTNDAITLCALERGDLVDCNDRALELFGLESKEEFLKNHPSDYSPPYQPDGYDSNKRARELIIKTLKGDVSTSFEWLHQRKDGNFFHAEVTLTKYKLGEETILQSNIRDITERKQAEQKIEDYTLELEQLYHQLDEELDKARHLHARLLPGALPVVEGLVLAAHYQPARRLGGDFYNAIRAGNKLVLYLSDVSGHGLDGSILSAIIKEAIDSYLILKPQEIRVEGIMQHLNRQYRRETYPDDYFISMFLAVLDLSNMEMTYTGAGFQVAPLVQTGDGERLRLWSEGPPISTAVPGEFMNFDAGRITLAPGSTLLFTTDGLTEQEVNGETYEKRFEEVFFEHSHLPPEVIVRVINNDFRRFNNGSLQGEDDITVGLVQLDPLEKREWNLELSSGFGELERLQREINPTISKLPGGERFYSGLHEMVVNAIEHGNRFDPAKRVTVKIIITATYMYAHIRDMGEGFNWRERIEKPFELNSYSARGRGIPMTRICSDLLFYNETGNRVSLTVLLPAGELK